MRAEVRERARACAARWGRPTARRGPRRGRCRCGGPARRPRGRLRSRLADCPGALRARFPRLRGDALSDGRAGDEDGPRRVAGNPARDARPDPQPPRALAHDDEVGVDRVRQRDDGRRRRRRRSALARSGRRVGLRRAAASSSASSPTCRRRLGTAGMDMRPPTKSMGGTTWRKVTSAPSAAASSTPSSTACCEESPPSVATRILSIFDVLTFVLSGSGPWNFTLSTLGLGR